MLGSKLLREESIFILANQGTIAIFALVLAYISYKAGKSASLIARSKIVTSAIGASTMFSAGKRLVMQY